MALRRAASSLPPFFLACLALAAPRALADVPPSSRPVLDATLGYVAFGGPGVTACRDAACLDREYRVLAMLDVRNDSGAERSGFGSVRIDVHGADGSVVSTSRGVVELVVVPDSVPESDASWAPCPAFAGTLPSGATRLRVQTWMTRRPPNGARIRVVLGTGSRSVRALGVLPPFEWPT